MPDNWGFVIAAYALAALVLGGYWRWLARREHDLLTLTASRSDRDDPTSRSRELPRPPHPRPDPGKRAPLQ
jgi:hypothetical protein